MNNAQVSSLAPSIDDDVRTRLDKAALKRAFKDNLFYLLGRFPEVATEHDLYMAAAYTVRDRMLDRFVASARTYRRANARTVCYLSAEFLLGPHLANNLVNLGITEVTREAATELGLDFDNTVIEQEEEPGLGNGGLGRLAACYMDSLATNGIPAIGYGIRYEFGIFDQVIEDGWQVEISDVWLRNGNPWEIARPKLRFEVPFGGHIERYEEDGRRRVRRHPELMVNGVAYDTPILGYGVANAVLLWKAEAPRSFDFQAFNTGDYYGADNFFLFGMTADQVRERRQAGYRPRDWYEGNAELRNAIDLIDSGMFSHGDTELFRPLTGNLLDADPFMVLADYQAYLDAQARVGQAWRDRGDWNRMSILNVARMGKFSSDRSIRDYCERIWHVDPVEVQV
jgi:glucan phosphorylase